MTEEELFKEILSYNWDEGLVKVEQFLVHSSCTYNLALAIFWLGDGYGFLTGNHDNINEDWLIFMTALQKNIFLDCYPKGRLPFSSFLTQVQVYQLKKLFPQYPKDFWYGNPVE